MSKTKEAAHIASQYQKGMEMLCQAYRSGVPGAASAALEFWANGLRHRTTEEPHMSTSHIEINGTAVIIEWRDGPDNSVGVAICSATQDHLEDGVGPSDGEEFTLDGVDYRLGEHDYSGSECRAFVYRA